MQFNSIDYLVFLLVAVIVYFAIPAKLRQFWLLAASYFFYMNWNAKYALLLLFSTFSTWVFALLIENHRKQARIDIAKIKNTPIRNPKGIFRA